MTHSRTGVVWILRPFVWPTTPSFCQCTECRVLRAGILRNPKVNNHASRSRRWFGWAFVGPEVECTGVDATMTCRAVLRGTALGRTRRLPQRRPCRRFGSSSDTARRVPGVNVLSTSQSVRRSRVRRHLAGRVRGFASTAGSARVVTQFQNIGTETADRSSDRQVAPR